MRFSQLFLIPISLAVLQPALVPAETLLTGDQVCIDSLTPWLKNSKVRVECGVVENPNAFKGDRVMTSGPEATNMQLNLQCTANKAQCNKVRAAFDTAFKLISNTVVLNEPLTVNASFVSFCQEYKECSSQYKILGSAGPARTIVMTDDDGKPRLFPQALLKQKGLTKHPKFIPFDIIAAFNADVDFWFEGDGSIKSTQSDFLFVIVHELIHGLGFSSAWMDYMNDVPKFLTPNILISNSSDLYVFNGFVENIFDKYLVEYPSLTPLTETTDSLNAFASGPGTIFNSEEEFSTMFAHSPQADVAKRTFSLATTGKTLAFLPKNITGAEKPVILETSLSPYAQGSSVSHVDFKTYSNTPDFLMRYMEDRGVSLETTVYKTGNNPGGAVGPQVSLILQSLGYTINPNPRPLFEILPMSGGSDASLLGTNNSPTCGRGLGLMLGMLTGLLYTTL
ncbi:hypothetical protein K493DRAFT_306400 [Basidiobolus meristosporus CBS 931.73]|uniref:Sequence orphan n=1 Tax=Basidiobolus meristosporus CBS 931.73 TaxID=1314790 RepID=A0A1Y1XSJ5_9FUNG|nr:hypothetical protein K493DRAFT_306400 [Basidiobolus meristosporus CBS 931.73]|eukprot:ORX88708.1 hypothetical protein K493DRAFT_306400 [Basidiobolus meristosporus CBS 931.73]